MFSLKKIFLRQLFTIKFPEITSNIFSSKISFKFLQNFSAISPKLLGIFSEFSSKFVLK